MEEAFRFFRAYEIWIYTLLALGGLIYIRKFILAWDELRGAAFGLERESAQARLNQAAGMLVLMVSMGMGVFVLVSFIGPSVPGANPLLTPTIDLLATSTITLPAEAGMSQVSLEPEPGTPIPDPQPLGEGCQAGRVMLTEPEHGTEITGVVTLVGTANTPNFAFFKYEVQRAGDPIWLTIQAERKVVIEDDLGPWDTRALPSGDYLLRLVVTDNEGEALPACVIQVRINNPMEP